MQRLLVVALLAGCSPTSYTFSPTFARGPSPKPEGCAFDVVTSQPERGYEEIGTLTFYNGTEPTTVDALKRVIAKQVCTVGGDAVIAAPNEKGQLLIATVVHYQPGPKK